MSPASVRLLPAALCVLLPLLVSASTPAAAQGIRFIPAPEVRGSGGVASLKSQLEAGLRARRPEEFLFVALIVERVEEGKLPRQLVLETFRWAQRRQPYPFPYFRRALTLRARRLGVSLEQASTAPGPS
jgi:hypothetical protein